MDKHCYRYTRPVLLVVAVVVAAAAAADAMIVWQHVKLSDVSFGTGVRHIA